MDSIAGFNQYAGAINSITTNLTGAEGSSVPQQIVSYINFLINHPEIKIVVEVGFNLGLSSAAFLSARPDVRVLSVDIGHHEYVRPCKAEIDALFPGRHTLVIGSSVEALPLLVGKISPDFILIDGDHRAPVPELDLQNAFRLGRPDTWFAFDDVCEAYGKEGVLDALADAIGKRQILLETLVRFESEDRGWIFFRKSPTA